MPDPRRARFPFLLVGCLLWTFHAAAWAEPSSREGGELSWDFKQQLLAPVRKWVNELEKQKNEEGVPFKSGSISRTPRRVDERTWIVTVHVNTAERESQATERYELTVVGDRGRDNFEVTAEKVIDRYVGLYRTTGVLCRPFGTFRLAREGMQVRASGGSVCEFTFADGVPYFAVQADDLAWEYAPPPHAQRMMNGHDFYAMHRLATSEHEKQLDYQPALAVVFCDVTTCDALLNESFTGLERPTAEQRAAATFDRDGEPEFIRPWIQDILEARKDNAFSGFRSTDLPGNRRYTISLPTDLKDRDDGARLSYNNWGNAGSGWEVTFSIWPKQNLPDQLVGPIYGYFTEETLTSTDPYELERRDDVQTRWFEVHSVRGTVDLATDGAEQLQGDVEFGLTLKREMSELPFAIISFSTRGPVGGSRPKPIVVNSLQVDGQEVTWVKTGPIGGRLVLPETLPAGSRIQVRMDWESRAILKYTSSYSFMPRQGWMPFVRFGDVIDDFELTIRSPAKFDVIGIGHKVDESIDGDVRISHWKADQPVNFPTIIFGRYQSDVPNKKAEAKKLDGTPIPVTVYVDKNSFVDWSIPPKALRPIATSAANSINLYAAVTGLDYQFGELNLVNDPLGFLYGQAPSSLIYLGSGVFRGEGSLAPYFVDSTGIAKFLKSVVAHEVGHQWWGNRVANANFRNYWFVESLAEYFSAIYLEQAFGWGEYEDQVDEWRRNILESSLKGSVQNADTLFSGEWKGGTATPARTAAIYNKGPYAFHMLRETMKGDGPRGAGAADKKFYEFLGKFSRELAAQREVVTLDIQRAAEEALEGADLTWFFDQWIRGSGMPQYSLQYDVRQAEDGGYILEGVIRQVVTLGKTDVVLENQVYRGVVDLHVLAKGGPYGKRFFIQEAETPFRLKLPVRPTDVVLNPEGEMLALKTRYE